MGFSIHISDLGKKFGSQRIFSGLELTFEQPDTYAILGSNGSGKSTLLQVLYGYMLPTSGSIKYLKSGTEISSEEGRKSISFTSPYMELIEELTAMEMVENHFRFRKCSLESYIDVLGRVGLEGAYKKQIRNFSSGMKQRLKLALAFFSESKALLLDEPCTNLDNRGIELYKKLIEEHIGTKLIIIASNLEHEYWFCNQHVELSL